MRMLITGANGFIGTALEHYLKQHDFANANICWTRAVRCAEHRQQPADCVVGDIDASTDWHKALQQVDVVVHLAARVHVMNELEADPLEAFRRVNTAGTLNLARQAIQCGVRRMIYLSSIKVNGEQTYGRAFSPEDPACPCDPYAQSKYEAEQQLLKLKDLEVVIIRPPLVYGPGVKGNLQRLMRLIALGLPLPLGGIQNSRSLLAVDNLCSFMMLALDSPAAAGQVFLLSDNQDLSTPQLLQYLAKAMDKKLFLFKLPAPWIRTLAQLAGREAEYQRLFTSLQVNMEKSMRLLNWQPPLTPQQAFLKYYRKQSWRT